MSKRTFCDANQEIREKINGIKDLMSIASRYDSWEGYSHDILVEIEHIADIVEETQEYVDSMEKRLFEYRDAIEDLGFGRIK